MSWKEELTAESECLRLRRIYFDDTSGYHHFLIDYLYDPTQVDFPSSREKLQNVMDRMETVALVEFRDKPVTFSSKSFDPNHRDFYKDI